MLARHAALGILSLLAIGAAAHSAAPPVVQSSGYTVALSSQGTWQATVAQPTDPYLILSPIEWDTTRINKLFLRLATDSGTGLQVFYSTTAGGGFDDARSARSLDLIADGKPHLYALDMRGLPGWTGTIRAIRIDLDGSQTGSRVQLWGCAPEPAGLYSENESPGNAEAMGLSPAGPAPQVHVAAWHDAIVATTEGSANSAVLTYVRTHHDFFNHVGLAKLVPGVETDGTVQWSASARDTLIEPRPGSLHARFQLGTVRVETDITPLMRGRSSEQWDGVAHYTIRAIPPAPLRLRLGGGATGRVTDAGSPLIQGNLIRAAGWQASARKTGALLSRPDDPLHVAVETSGSCAIASAPGSGQYLDLRFAEGAGDVMLAFAPSPDQAEQLLALPHAALLGEVDTYYRSLFAGNHISTPDPIMNNAFQAALVTLEYNWLQPIGWIESVHHWPMFWHMQATTAADWIGQSDRSRACLLTHAAHQLSNGAIPHLSPSLTARRDFGGTNQFYFAQAGHYLNSTADRETMRTLAPVLDRALAQTFTENDADGDYLLGWGAQIGNQEDLIHTPYAGTSPTIEGINMLRTRAKIARALNDPATAMRCEERAGLAGSAFRQRLWRSDLGRALYFLDPLGEPRLDGQYHTLIYPVLADLLDPCEAWTSIRHLRDRLTGPDGAIYCSNNFPHHLENTCGSSAGAAQQPWGARGLAAVGLRDEAWRPLKAAASWAMSSTHGGAWPEVANDTAPSHFSPPASLYIAAVIEALFGLEMNKPENLIRIRPCFPSDWPSARLVLPGITATYLRDQNTYSYTVTTSEPLARHVEWKLPPADIRSVKVNGRNVPYTEQPGIDCITLRINTPVERLSEILIRLHPIRYTLDHVGSIAEGDKLAVKLGGATIEGIVDAQGILTDQAIDRDGHLLHAQVSDSLLTDFSGFGRLGRMNFARRTCFLACRAGNQARFYIPMTLTILPRCEASGTISDQEARLLVRNNTDRKIDGRSTLRIGGQVYGFPLELPAREEIHTVVVFPAEQKPRLASGANRATLLLAGREALDLTLIATDIQGGVMEPQSLPQDRLIESDQIAQLRPYYAYGAARLADFAPTLLPLAGQTSFTLPALPQVPFRLQGNKLVPISWTTGQAQLQLKPGAGAWRKFYVLLVPYLDNHDVFSRVGRVTAVIHERSAISTVLCTPGSLDWGSTDAMFGNTMYATAREPRPDRYGLTPLLARGASDWALARPPDFPQNAWWSDSLWYSRSPAFFSIVELDLGGAQSVASLIIETLGATPGFGIVAVTGERP